MQPGVKISTQFTNDANILVAQELFDLEPEKGNSLPSLGGNQWFVLAETVRDEKKSKQVASALPHDLPRMQTGLVHPTWTVFLPSDASVCAGFFSGLEILRLGKLAHLPGMVRVSLRVRPAKHFSRKKSG